MDKTSVMVRFSIYGDNFNPSIITKGLELMPTETHIKGERKKNGKSTWKDTSWSINTGYENSHDINEQLEKVTLLLKGRVDKLIELKDSLCVSMLFMIIVKIENNETPAMYFKKPFIHFLSRIDAEVGFDVYVYS